MAHIRTKCTVFLIFKVTFFEGLTTWDDNIKMNI